MPSIEFNDELEACWIANQASLYRQALRLTRDPDEAEDLVGEALARAVAKADKYQIGTNMRAWLGTILSHERIDQSKGSAMKTQSRSRSLTDTDSQLSDSQVQPTARGDFWQSPVENEVLRSNTSRDVHRAIDSLPPKQALVVKLAHIEDVPYIQISQALRIPIGTVASRINRGIAHLRESEILKSG